MKGLFPPFGVNIERSTQQQQGLVWRVQARARLREIHASLLQEHLRQLQAQEMDVDVAKAMGWDREADQVPLAAPITGSGRWLGDCLVYFQLALLQPCPAAALACRPVRARRLSVDCAVFT